MQIFYTILAGVSVYVLGQSILKLFIEPIQELRKEIQLVISDCTYYEHIVLNMQHINEELIKEASRSLRKRAAELKSKASIVPFLNCFAKCNIVPTQQDISHISAKLIGLSNVTTKDGDFKSNGANYGRLVEIEALLKIKRD